MRLAFILSTLLLSSASFANCLGEAQLTAKILSVQNTANSCVAYPDSSQVSFFSYNGNCVLDLPEIMSTGVTMSVSDTECRVGGTISGQLELQADGSIVLAK